MLKFKKIPVPKVKYIKSQGEFTHMEDFDNLMLKKFDNSFYCLISYLKKFPSCIFLCQYFRITISDKIIYSYVGFSGVGHIYEYRKTCTLYSIIFHTPNWFSYVFRHMFIDIVRQKGERRVLLGYYVAYIVSV